MAVLSDHIEQFIKSMMDDCDQYLELQRNELASYFQCAPSQINYVLTTRFSPERGYRVESRRGGGGYIKVERIDLDPHEHVLTLIREKLGSGRISARDASRLIAGLKETGLADETQARLMEAAVSERALSVPSASRDAQRASILKEMLLALLR